MDKQFREFLEATERFYRHAEVYGWAYKDAERVLREEIDKSNRSTYSALDAIALATIRVREVEYNAAPEVWRTVHEVAYGAPRPGGPLLEWWRRRWNALRREVWRAVHGIAWPSYECEDCVGMRSAGCYCDAMGADRAGGGVVPLWRRILRKWIR